METTDTRATAFGRVVGAIMEARGIPAEPDRVKALAERAGFDGEDFLARVAGGVGPDLGDLDGEMGLSRRERDALATAYTFEKDLACAVPGCERLAALGNSLGDCEEHREAYDARAELEAWRFARRVLEPWTTATREIGFDELTRVMENALGEAEEAVAAAHAGSSVRRPRWAGSRPRTVLSVRAGVSLGSPGLLVAGRCTETRTGASCLWW